MKSLQPFEIELSGINLVEASAGTGKTYNITSLYIRTLIERDISVGKILVVTYTEAATKELKDRLLKRIRQSVRVLKTNEVPNASDQFLHELLQNVEDYPQAINRLEKAVRNFDEASIYTIHGFCYQALQEQAFKSRAMYDAEMIGDDSELVLEVIDDYWRKWIAEMSEDPVKHPLIKLMTDDGCEPEQLAKEMGPHLGKPYLKVLPGEVNGNDIENKLHKLNDIFGQLKGIWDRNYGEIFDLLNTGHLSHYRTNWLEGWMEKMDEVLSVNTPPIKFFDKFERFCQGYIDNNLKAASEKEGIEPPQHPFFKAADQYCEIAESLESYDVIFKKQLLNYLQRELQDKKEDLQLLSYDDLLLRLRNALLEGERGQNLADQLRNKYPLALVDEFQDTDPNQYDIFRRIYGTEADDSALFMIGDPKQSIYSFRGADVYSYLEARQDAPEQNMFNLERNFRSTPKLIEGLNTFFGKHPNPFILQEIPYQKVRPGMEPEAYDHLTEDGEERPPIRFRQLSQPGQDQLDKSDAADKAAEDTAKKIQRLIENGKSNSATIGSETVQAKDIAVLVRTHDQANLMSEVLRDKNIKSVQYSQESVFESEQARQLEVFLKAVAEPANETLVKTALSLPLTGYTAKELLDVEEDEQRWVELLDQFDDWHSQWQEQGFSAMFRSVINEAAVSENLMKYPDGERRLTNILHLGELLQAEAQHQKEGTRGLLKWLSRKRKDADEQQDEEQLRLESDQELVKVVTMHRSKGLEYPIVFCPFLWYGPRYQNHGNPLVYHDPNDLETTYLDLNSKADPDRDRKRKLVAREELAESLRLAYVSMTRAKQCCYLTWTYAKKSEFSPLGYLLLGPDTVFDLLDETISDSYNSLASERMDKEIARLCESYPNLFTKEGASAVERQQGLFDGDELPTLSCQTFERSLPLEPSYNVSSFSSLTSWMNEDPDIPDYDQFLENGNGKEAEKAADSEMSMFTFPRGPQPGTCIHNIFEELDFTDLSNADEHITRQLSLHGIDEKWHPVVREMLQKVMDIPLHPSDDGLKMSVLSPDDVLPEMEFYYQNEEIKSQQLLSIIRENHTPKSEIGGTAEAGFLKGFIDLTFRFEGKYYLLDYKTNHLGDSYEDYRQEELEHEIQEASYDLQYYIYTVALHRFLKKTVPDYSYNQHFGGAFYLFLRGMNEEGRQGIFFDRPEYSTIESLNQYILAGEEHE